MKTILRFVLLYIPVMPFIATGGWLIGWLLSDMEDANYFVKFMHHLLITGEERYDL